MKKSFKKLFSFLIVALVLLSTISCNGKNANSKGDVYILNFGDYLADEAIEIFESETGLRLHQDYFEANEEVIPVLESGAKYDAICISDYCIERLIKKGLLAPLDKNKLPNYGNINKDKLKELSVCDNNNTYAVPYFCGGIGIAYNKNIFDKLGLPYPTSWKDLFNEKLKGELLMQSSIRDLYTVGLKMNGYSANTMNKDEIDKATEDFIKQKPYVSGYMVDQIKDKFISGECSIAPITSGDIQYMYVEGGKDEYVFVVPKEGTCNFIDAWCVLKNSENPDFGHLFIDYMCREDIARINAEYIGYESVNDKTPDNEFLEMKKIPNRYFDYSNPSLNEIERDVGDAIRYYSDGYNRLKAS